MVIIPTVGRVVWFYKYNAVSGHEGPLAAHVCKVNSPSNVNLMVIGEQGVPYSETSVPLIQEGEVAIGGNYCSWMPYQVGQAKKHAAEDAAAK